MIGFPINKSPFEAGFLKQYFVCCVLVILGIGSSQNNVMAKNLAEPALLPEVSMPSEGIAQTVHRMPALQASVKKTQFLPGEMYGQWSVTGRLVKTNAKAGFFPEQTQNIWQLERHQGSVSISNPVNGASATIQVDQVEGNKAVFHRVSHPQKNRYLIEIPEITVKGNALFGQTFNKVRTVKSSQVVQEFYAIYDLQARRLSAPSAQFKPIEEVFEPDFEVAPIQYEAP